MPIGDPMGSELYDLGRGTLKRVWTTRVPVKDLDDAIDFYRDSFGLALQVDDRSNGRAVLGADDPLGRVELYVPGPNDKRQPGGDTGVVFATDSVFELHRRLVDEGVVFLLKPERQPWGGVLVMFQDRYGNIFRAVDDSQRYSGENLTKEKDAKERESGVTIRFVPTQP
jgi:catechol 2,3-dioxygenase-like lactoylglutathione lyase family enzyme